MRRDQFSIDVCIYSLVLFIHVFVKMYISAREVSTWFAKVTFYIFMRKPNFEVNPKICEYHVLRKEYIKYVHRRETL